MIKLDFNLRNLFTQKQIIFFLAGNRLTIIPKLNLVWKKAHFTYFMTKKI